MWVIYMVFDWLSGRKDAERQAKLYAQEKQKLEEESKRKEKHTKAVYGEIVNLFAKRADFVAHLGDWLICPDPDGFAEELSHLEAYNALSIIKCAKELCKAFNTDLEKAVSDTKNEFAELWEKFAEKECKEDKKFSLQRYDMMPHPDRYYSPDVLAWNIYHDAGAFHPYEIQPMHQREGWYRVGNGVAETDNLVELKRFTDFANEHSLKKVEVFKELHAKRRVAMAKLEEFFDALGQIERKLKSGNPLKGKCGNCPDNSENSK
jgi:hypothetical protein